jgi:beta-lactam-binding protein with PASTA domain
VTALLRAGYLVSIDPSPAPADPIEAPGQVADQSPLPGQTAEYGSQVVLTLTAGSDTTATVPTQLPASAPG